MDEHITSLQKIVEDGIVHYRDLIAHAEEKAALLTEGKLDAIVEHNKADETLYVQLRILEEGMSRLCGLLGRSLRIAPEKLTLWNVAEGLEEKDADGLKSRVAALRRLAERLRTINRRNAKLSESSLRYSHGMLDFLANVSGSYRRNGLLEPGSAVRGTISREA